MKIDDNLTASTYLRPAQTERVQNEPTAPPSGGRRTEQGENDSVSLSSLSSEISRALSEPSPEEITRVEQAREAVQTGQLTADPGATADSLINAAIADTGSYSSVFSTSSGG
ncbi:MAG: flagellar biosynthesis anti-sigma factor FlgM [Acidobacteria bacterium]|nr:flagellar biosynthesis anti-sigma factor FlgM [Acidobacteriota bacterium]